MWQAEITSLGGVVSNNAMPEFCSLVRSIEIEPIAGIHVLLSPGGLDQPLVLGAITKCLACELWHNFTVSSAQASNVEFNDFS
jgi:hypothetical protein